MNSSELSNRLNAKLTTGDFLLFLSPKNQQRYQFLVDNLPARFQQQIHEAFYVFRDEDMITSLYQAVHACSNSTTL